MDNHELRLHAESLVESLHTDALIPDRWYDIPTTDRDKWVECLSFIINKVEDTYLAQLSDMEKELEDLESQIERLENNLDNQYEEISDLHDKVCELESALDRAREGSA